MGLEMADGLKQSFQQNILRRLDIRGEAAGEKRDAVIQNDYDPLRGKRKMPMDLTLKRKLSSAE